jgi:hypothetical protein
MGGDDEMLSIYDVDGAQSQEPTQVGGSPIVAKKN